MEKCGDLWRCVLSSERQIRQALNRNSGENDSRDG